MDIDAGANFLVGSVLFGLGFSVLSIAVVFINNVFHKYWKPVTLVFWPKYMDTPPARFMTPEEVATASTKPDSKPLDLSINR